MAAAPGRELETMAREALAAWEKAAGAYSERMVRDPRTMEIGAVLLRASLEHKRACDQLIAQAWSNGTALVRAMLGDAR